MFLPLVDLTVDWPGQLVLSKPRWEATVSPRLVLSRRLLPRLTLLPVDLSAVLTSRLSSTDSVSQCKLVEVLWELAVQFRMLV